MTLTQRPHLQLALVATLVAGLAAADWWRAPERAGLWLISLATMAVIWLVAGLIARAGATRGTGRRDLVVLSALVAGLMLAVALASRLIEAMGFDRVLSERLAGVAIGLGLAVIGNLTPKLVEPLAPRRCSPVQIQSLRRFSGWSFTLAGLAYVAVWLIAPVDLAEMLALSLCAVAFLLVLGRWGLVLLTRPD
jgi:hypothetical protein